MASFTGGVEELNQAAALAFAMLRFEQEAAHEWHAHEWPGQGHLGVDRFVFLPSWRSTPRVEVVSFLASLPCPALIVATTIQGIASLILLDELSGDRRSWGQKTLDNQLAGIDELASKFDLALQPDSKILLELRDESYVVSLDVLRLWSQRFSCPTGWNIGEPRPGAKNVSAQIRLFSSDGRVSPPSQDMAPWQRPAW